MDFRMETPTDLPGMTVNLLFTDFFDYSLFPVGSLQLPKQLLSFRTLFNSACMAYWLINPLNQQAA